MLLAAFALVGAAWSLGYFQPPGHPVVYTVQKGENFAGISKKLEAQGVIRSARAFRWYRNLLGSHKTLQRGEFALSTNMPVPAVITALTEGKPIEYKFTIPEGENIFQIAEELEAKGFASKADFLAATRSPELIQMLPGADAKGSRPFSIEGYAYPDTYLLQKVFSAKEIAQMMVMRFREIYKTLEPEFGSSVPFSEFHFNPHQMVTLASIVEKETGNGEERPVIASVFVNRLRKKMRLQTDPTIVYGIYLAKGAWNGNITRRDLDAPGPYNSYQSNGLPPGPIANPGISALRAALHPANTDYLYFVSRGDGTTIFSKEYGAHAKAVRETQLTPHAKDGKSWRDLAPEKRAK
jgi:UPF0755 protein